MYSVESQGTKDDEPDLESMPLLSHQKEQRMVLQCLLLEAGILFHSIFIGLSISVSTGTTFIALMIAITFHQIFEGLALGARIAAIPSLQITSFRPWGMSFAVSC
jgi:zinc transporter 1/2/3